MRIESVLGYEFVTVLIFTVFLLSSLFLFIYGLMQAHLVYQYLKSKRKGNANLFPPSPGPLTRHPCVTVQLPVYNEQYVMERLIDAVARLRYPKDRLEVQVLDDSTDESVAITARKVAEWQRTGLDIKQIRRPQRKGYKAGALQEALPAAKGEFIAIFDADFVPGPDFLEKTLPAFTGPEVGMVQTRWDHLNKGYSLLTHIQSFLIDAHFSVEQAGRNACGYFINFSGTGGVWRKACIIDAGGWNSDTLTEDFDLSYRAQLKGWKFRYLEHVGAPAELPPVMSALKTQQFRWIKGITETSKKHLGNVLTADVGLPLKIHAALHLSVGLVFVSAFLCSFLSLPLLLLKHQVPHMEYLYAYTSFSMLNPFFLMLFHYVATLHTQSAPADNRRAYFWRKFPFYVSFSMGIALHNAVAVLEGWSGKKSTFARTPKFNVTHSGETVLSNVYRKVRLSPLNYLEGLMVVYYLTGALLAFVLDDFSMFPYHLMLAFGFGLVCWFSWQEMKGTAGSKKSVLRHGGSFTVAAPKMG